MKEPQTKQNLSIALSSENTVRKKKVKPQKNIRYVAGRKSPWLLTIYADGKRKYESFTSEAAAIRRRTQIEMEKKANGLRAMFFSQEERAEYLAAREILENANRKISVLDAVRVFEENLRKYEQEQEQKRLTMQACNFTDAFDAYLQSKVAAGRRAHTIHEINVRVGNFCERFKDVNPSELTKADVETYCVREGLSPRSCKNEFVAVASFLNFCARRGYMKEPLKFDETKSFLPRILAKQKTVFSLDETKSFFEKLQSSETRRCFIPFYALQFFCGIRRTEAERMKWEWIDFANKTITLPADITKTGDEHIMRAPMLPGTVFAWLEPFKKSRGKIKTPSPETIVRIAQDYGWKRNVARHTFCTMHVSLHGDAGKTALLLRHRGQSRLWQNYLARIVPEQDAQKYFNLIPAK